MRKPQNGTRAKKSLGQNFLMHARIAERIVMVSGVRKDDTVLEIGPGRGMLTQQLLLRSRKVIAVEADGELFKQLQETFAGELQNGKLELLHADIRTFDTTTIKGPYALVANIPYYITGEIIRMFLSAPHQPSSMTLLVQKEVAARIARSKKESILSLSVKAYGIPKYEFTVPRGAFKPAPGVDSAILSIRDISRKNFASSQEEERFFNYLHAGFAHKRKFLASNLAGGGLSAEGIAPKARAENLALEDWLALGGSKGI
jgi:16S rRNA (adenine1518-N6/adenine1519-N6)-dimethyltransferase